jgi:hypothetical protein
MTKILAVSLIHSNPQTFLLLYRTYLTVEGGGDQGGHDDHGDNDLDGGGDGRSHVECVVCFLLINAREMKSRIMSWMGRGATSLITFFLAWLVVVHETKCWLARAPM